MEYPIHPACAVFPLPPKQEIDELAQSIKQNGLLEPITLTPDSLLLDGRCRLMACQMAGVEVRTTIYQGNDPTLFALDKNIRRRHLTNAQRELAVAKLANLQHGSNQYQRKEKVGPQIEGTTSVKDAAKRLGVSRAGIERARTIIDNAVPHVVEMVRNGEVKSYLAAEAVRNTAPSVQANWTAEDVKREGRKVVNREPARQVRQTRPKEKEWVENLGHLSKLDLGSRPLRRGEQRVFTCPPHIQDLKDAGSLLGSAIGAILRLYGHARDGDFDAALKLMLAYQPVLGKTNGEEINFAAKARKELKADIGDRLHLVIVWLTRLEATMAELGLLDRAA